MNILSPGLNSIADFFSAYALPQATQVLSSGLKAANSNKIWKHASPADLICFCQQLEQLLQAVFTLVEEGNRVEEARLSTPIDDNTLLNNYQAWCGWHRNSTPWDFFPRHLSKKEFIDPWKALEKITRSQSCTQWKNQLSNILQYALSKADYTELDNQPSLLQTYLLLHKLLEATHLIEVRAIKEDTSGPRPKWKNRELKLNEES